MSANIDGISSGNLHKVNGMDDYNDSKIDQLHTMHEKLVYVSAHTLEGMSVVVENLGKDLGNAISILSKSLELASGEQEAIVKKIKDLKYKSIPDLSSSSDSDKTVKIAAVNANNQEVAKKLDAEQAALGLVKAEGERLTSMITNLQSNQTELSTYLSSMLQNYESNVSRGTRL